MQALKYRIPQFQPLPPSVFFKNGNTHGCFPFSAEKSQYYYLARNAIWHGVDALGLNHGDVVLMPAYHHGIEVETLLKKGLKLVYYRIDEQLKIDFSHLESIVSPEAKALYVINYFGFPQPVEELKAFAQRHKLKMIEDCALALLSCSNGRQLGTFGDIGIFCLYKTLPVPHGGMLVLNDSSLSLPAEPRRPDMLSAVAYLGNRLLDNLDINFAGVGFRLNKSIKSAARVFKRRLPSDPVPVDTEQLVEEHLDLGVSPITHYLIERLDADFIVKQRRSNYALLASLLKGKVEIPFPELPAGVCPLFFPIITENKLALHAELVRRGIEAVYFWSRNHPDVPVGKFPEVDYLRQHILEIPIHQGLQSKHIEYIASILKELV